LTYSTETLIEPSWEVPARHDDSHVDHSSPSSVVLFPGNSRTLTMTKNVVIFIKTLQCARDDFCPMKEDLRGKTLLHMMVGPDRVGKYEQLGF
jgi:hypothetical protein